MLKNEDRMGSILNEFFYISLGKTHFHIAFHTENAIEINLKQRTDYMLSVSGTISIGDLHVILQTRSQRPYMLCRYSIHIPFIVRLTRPARDLVCVCSF